MDVSIIDASDVPENYLGPIEASGADLVLVLDAADLGASPGDLSLIEMHQLKDMGVSTHTANLALLFKVIPQTCRPGAVLVGDTARVNESKPRLVTKRGYCDEGIGAIANSVVR